MPEVIEHPLIDEILEEHRSHARGETKAWQGYRGHAHRIFNLARSLAPDAPDRDEKLAIVAAFHDIEVFSTMDYLAPSIDTQTAWLEKTERGDWAEELAHVSAYHHKPTAYTGPFEEMTEAFRKGDWCEVSFGARSGGIDKDLTGAVKDKWSISGFLPGGVAKFYGKWVIRHPLDPAPILRPDRAMERRRKL